MKKFFLLIMASMLTLSMTAAGTGDGSTKANAIEFDWDKGITHAGGTLWYRVDLAPLYEEENPSLTLYLTNPSNAVGTSVDVSMKATVAGQEESKKYTIAARQYKTYTANASMLVRMKQTEIFLTLTSNGKIKLSAKVFESADLDETCKDARVLSWNTETTQNPMYSAWWKIDLKPAKDAVKKDAKITLTNTGSKTVNLKVGQSLDCPSSGLTKREYELAPGQAVENIVPQSMIKSVQPDEIYFGIENVESQISMKVELVDQPAEPVIPATAAFEDLHVTDTKLITAGKHFYRISVAEMRDTAKYEPEFTYRNLGAADAKVSVKMAFEVPAFSTSDAEYDLAANGGEEIVVYKKNMLEGLSESIEYIYLLTECDKDINFYGRFKHVREGKACKTNIDFSWENGHSQEARTTQWYAVNVADARDNTQDIIVHLVNLSAATAKVNASLAFSCPYIDLQELSHSIEAKKEEVRTLRYSTYAMMSDTVWIGLETNQDIKFWAETKPAQTKTPDTACEKAIPFNWEDGVFQAKGDTVWYKIDMEEAREKSAKFPTVFVQNQSATNEVKITAELSLECPDSIENQKRTLTIAANGSYSKQVSRNLFEHISQPEIYLCVVATEDVSLQIRLTEEAAGSSCSSAIPFNWVSGNTQDANANLWYSVDLRNVMQRGNDLKLHLQNRAAEKGNGVIQLAYSCPVEDAPSIQNFTLAANAQKDVTVQNSALETLEDSIIYINLQGTTGLRFWADTLAVVPFDTIFADGITLVPLKWNTLYTQSKDTAWYVIPQSEIEFVKNLDQKVKPVAHLMDATSSEKLIKVEAAFAFPIGKQMMTKSQLLKADQHFTDTVPAGTFDQLLKKDSIILRVTRAKGAGEFQFQAELIKAFNGNSRNDALPVRMGERFAQSPNTEMWYKIKTTDLKKDKTLYNKQLWVSAKNAGAGDAKVTVHVYEGLLSQTDMLDEFGLGDYRERTIKKGLGKSHHVPAQAIYAVGDVELYVQVRTTDSLVVESAFTGEYAPQAVDPAQAKAKLLVPNVDYVLPGDNQEHWYQVCIPYIRNNYKYAHSAKLTYELDGTATIEGTATLQDNMDCQMPVRKRTINKSGKHYVGTRLLSDLLSKAVRKATDRDFDITSFQEQFIDSMLHRYVTADSITAYVRIKSDKEIKARLDIPQITGDDCMNAMSFDWEHGNVNPKDAHTWYVAALDTTKLYQEGKSLRLHVDNWSEDKANSVSASLYFKCGDPSQGDITKTIAAGDSLKKDIALDFIKASSPELIFIECQSSEAAHIWIEKIDLKRDTVYADTTFFVCKGATVLGNTINVDTVWNDTVRNIKDEEKLALYDSITTIKAFVLREPKTYDISDQVDIERNAVLDLTTADTWLKAQYAADDNDTIQTLSSIKWQYAVYPNETFKDIDLTNQPIVSSERIKVRYFAFTECTEGQDPDPSKGIVVYKNYLNTARDTAKITACNKYKWPENDSLYIESTTANPDSVVFPGGANWGDSILYLSLTLNNPARFDLQAISKYGNRLILINRYDFEAKGYKTDPIYVEGGAVKVEWFDASDPSKSVREGYAHYNEDGTPLVGTFYAVVTIDNGSACGLFGRTQDVVCGAAAGLAPALAPSIVMPGEDIKVLNLNPEAETIIRIFTTEGLLQHTYNVRGQETFTIKAANDHGFYLVELLNGEEKSTLRYIVK